MSPRILLVDADLAWRDHFCRAIAGLPCELESVTCVADARLALSQSHFNLVLVASRLRGGPGLTFVQELRAQSRPVDVLVLASMADTNGRVLALLRGADAVIERSLRADELRLLIARKLARPTAPVRDWCLGRVVLHALRPCVTLDELTVPLTPAEHRILVQLAQAAGTPVPRQLLQQAIRPDVDDASSRPTLDSHISRLRIKLAPTGLLIETARSVGYMLRVDQPSNTAMHRAGQSA